MAQAGERLFHDFHVHFGQKFFHLRKSFFSAGSAAHAAVSDFNTRGGGGFPGSPFFCRPGNPVEQVFEDARIAVIMLRKEDPDPVRAGDFPPHARNRLRRGKFRVGVDHGDIRIIQLVKFGTSFEHFCRDRCEHPVGGFFFQRADDAKYILHGLSLPFHSGIIVRHSTFERQE